MRPWLSLAVGALIGQWLAFGGTPSPAQIHTLGLHAFARHDYAEAARMWSHAVSMQPDNPSFHYFLATSLAQLGQARSAADAYQVALMLEPSAPLAKLATDGLARLAKPVAANGVGETIVQLEASRGVWVAYVTVNGREPSRFLVDTGASVTLVSPPLAKALGVAASAGVHATELQTVAGSTAGTAVTLASVRLGTAEAHDVPAVIHDPGLDLDGILGNSFLGRFTVTFDADRRQLHLRAAAQ
jgi:clan AA aspartic protease (TIGR02281 family)